MKKTAFTLAELLTAVLVISVIMVALAPVITKRMKDNISVTTDNKKGLEIFTNPGTYTFDVPIGINTLFIQGSGGGGGGAGASESGTKNTAFTSNSSWTVPNGVNKITLTITGSGGGGGAGNGNSTGATSCENNPASNGLKPNSSELSKYPLFHAVRISDNGTDLCIFKRNVLDDGVWTYSNTAYNLFKAGEACNGIDTCCWYSPPGWSKDTSGVVDNDYPYSYKPERRAVCMYKSAASLCERYGARVINNQDAGYDYRLPTSGELRKVLKFINEYSRNAGNNGLQLCSNNFRAAEPNNVPYCGSGYGNCPGAAWNGRCDAETLWASDLPYSLIWYSPESLYIGGGMSATYAASARCVKSLKYYNNRGGAGGNSGAVMEKEINVLPGDTLQIAIGSGGAGGKYNVSVNNGLAAQAGNGAQGAITTITHKRGSTTLGTYSVKGGFGGYGARPEESAQSISQNDTTPAQMCSAVFKKQISDTSFTTQYGCTYPSYPGDGGSVSAAGRNGGKVKNEGTITQGQASSGGYMYIDENRTANQRATNEEIRLAKGQNASTPGFGGGGGLTPAWANSTSHFYQGGKGANGKVEITYKVALPGGGGGSSARVGGVNSEGKMYEIQYKVKEGDRIVFKVGSGGTGGVASQDGTNGSATVVGDNDIVFLAGEGGKTATNDDKNNLKGGRGGSTSCINENNDIQTTTLGVKIKNTTTTKYSYMPSNSSFKGQNGKRGGVPSSSDIQGGYGLNNTIFNYGFTGGMGASPFGINTSKMSSSISCGGGNISGISSISLTLGQTTNINYLCASGNPKGNSALSHDPVNNEFGGSGGGGGGVVDDSFEQGTGGNGSSGYLRIRWDASEQE